MKTPPLSSNQIDAYMTNLKAGYTICVACGIPSIHPDDPEWKIRCSACYAAAVPSGFCRECGDSLEPVRVEYAKKKGGECTRCLYCSKNWNVKLCHPCGFKHPSHYHSTSHLSSPSSHVD